MSTSIFPADMANTFLRAAQNGGLIGLAVLLVIIEVALVFYAFLMMFGTFGWRDTSTTATASTTSASAKSTPAATHANDGNGARAGDAAVATTIETPKAAPQPKARKNEAIDTIAALICMVWAFFSIVGELILVEENVKGPIQQRIGVWCVQWTRDQIFLLSAVLVVSGAAYTVRWAVGSLGADGKKTKAE